MDAQVFKQLSRLTKTQVEALSTNAQKFTSTDFAEKLVASWRGPTSLADFRRIGRRAQHAYGRPVAFNCEYFLYFLPWLHRGVGTRPQVGGKDLRGGKF